MLYICNIQTERNITKLNNKIMKNPYTLTAVNLAENNPTYNIIFSSENKKETNAELRRLIKNGEVVKGGYDYFLASNLSIEIRKNY